MRFGILHRHVIGEVFRSFFLAFSSITAIFVLAMVMSEASRIGLEPREVLFLIPYVIPGSTPYTIPVSLLFAVTVVYGRLASDNEVIAVKAAGLSAWTLIWPSALLGSVFSVAFLILGGSAIPAANHSAKKVIFSSFEDVFYKFLKKDREFARPDWPFLIKVRDVEGHTLIDATFKHRAPSKQRVAGVARKKEAKSDDESAFDLIIQARRAKLSFDLDRNLVHVYLDGADVQHYREGSSFVINDTGFDFAIPSGSIRTPPKMIEEMTDAEISVEETDLRMKLALERRRQALAASLFIASGRVREVSWHGVQRSFVDFAYWKSRSRALNTERALRKAMAWGSTLFVLLGAPVGIMAARKDFLSAFMVCFIPIIICYYPLTLLGKNLGKEGILHPFAALWMGNALLAVLSTISLRTVLKH